MKKIKMKVSFLIVEDVEVFWMDEGVGIYQPMREAVTKGASK